MSAGISKRFTRILGRSKGQSGSSDDLSQNDRSTSSTPDPNGPEGTATGAVRLFCDSGTATNSGEEVLHLPVIVEAAESSPAAAAAAAQQIRKYLSKEFFGKPHVQYNAIMLIRILSDNPGTSFTRNFDKPFVGTVKELLRNSKDGNLQQLLRETLDALEASKMNQTGVDVLITMWRKEKGQGATLHHHLHGGNRFPVNPTYQGHGDFRAYGNAPISRQARSPHSETARQLPPPTELASRIEEARNTAKILLQLVQSTPPEQVLTDELVKEFRERCQAAQRSMEGYINCNNPHPDDDTMLTLIETNEQLSLAATRYQRCALAARKAMGLAPSPNQEMRGGQNGMSSLGSPPVLPAVTSQNQSLFGSQSAGVSAFASGGNGASQLTSRDDAPTSQWATRSHDFAAGPQRTTQPAAPVAPVSDPFADPEQDNALPSTVDPSHYNSPPPTTQTFNIDTEPTYAASSTYSSSSRRNTRELNDAYAGTYTPVSALESTSDHSRDVSDPYTTSPQRTFRKTGAADATGGVSELEGHSTDGKATSTGATA